HGDAVPAAGAAGGVENRQFAERVHSWTSSSARSITSSSGFGRGRGLGAGGFGAGESPPTERRIAAAISPLTTSSSTGRVRGGNSAYRAPRSNSAAVHATRSASFSLTSLTATTGVSGHSRR